MRVMVVDNHKLFREVLIYFLRQEEGIQVIDQAGHIYEALEKLVACRPDVLLMGIPLLDGDGIDVTSTINRLSPNTKIVFLTMLEDEKLRLQALQAGAGGYLTKDIDYPQLVEALKALDRSADHLSR